MVVKQGLVLFHKLRRTEPTGYHIIPNHYPTYKTSEQHSTCFCSTFPHINVQKIFPKKNQQASLLSSHFDEMTIYFQQWKQPKKAAELIMSG